MTQPVCERTAFRAAAKIHERLQAPPVTNILDFLPAPQWDRLRRALWLLRKAEVRGWQVAARELSEEADYQAMQLASLFESFRKQLSARPIRHVQSLDQIVADLEALGDEFEEVQIDLRNHWVAVVTAPIELEELWLGPFAIRLWWERLGIRRPYEVIAQSPQRPARDQSVTHPHVHDNQLCEGDASQAIKLALAGGRILDFFVLVRQTLETYNSGSPYVPIDEWQGRRCPCCDYSMSDDDASGCAECDTTVCSECTVWCRSCDRYICVGCADPCANCAHSFCGACLTKNAKTGQLLCKSCYHQGVRHATDDEERAAPAADAVRLGQIAAAA
jgi:hypothetical protein